MPADDSVVATRTSDASADSSRTSYGARQCGPPYDVPGLPQWAADSVGASLNACFGAAIRASAARNDAPAQTAQTVR